LNSRLPIYRSLSKRLEILGLSLWEIAFLVSGFVIFTEVFSFIPYRSLIGFGIVFVVAGILRHLNRRFEQHFLARLARFATLPDSLDRSLYRRKGKKPNG